MTPFQHGLPGLLQQSDLTDIPFNLTRQDASREQSLLFPQASMIVPGPPSTESIECTYHSPITDAERAVTQQSQLTRSTSCQRTCATQAAFRTVPLLSAVLMTTRLPAENTP